MRRGRGDVTGEERLVGDKKGWKEKVEGRIDYLCKWESRKRNACNVS